MPIYWVHYKAQRRKLSQHLYTCYFISELTYWTLSVNRFMCISSWKCGTNPDTVLRQFFTLPFSGKQKDYPLEMFFDSFTGELLICIWPFKARSSPLCFCVQSWLVANSDSISQGSRCASWNDFFFLSTNYNRYRNGRWMLYNPLRVIKERQTPFRLLWQSTFSPFYSFQLLFKIFYYEIYFYVVDIFGFILYVFISIFCNQKLLVRKEHFNFHYFMDD